MFSIVVRCRKADCEQSVYVPMTKDMLFVGLHACVCTVSSFTGLWKLVECDYKIKLHRKDAFQCMRNKKVVCSRNNAPGLHPYNCIDFMLPFVMG